VDSERETEAQRRGDAVVDDALAWLTSLPAGRPFFAWVHLYDAHAPYEPPSPFGERFASHPYDGEVAFVDVQVGRLLDTLRARRRLEDTIVVAIGDHGEGLGDHGEDDHGIFLYDSVLRIPWLMRGPGVPRDRVVAEQVRAIDLVPTLCEMLGIGLPANVDGEGLMPLLRGGSRPHAPPSYAETYYGRLHFGWSELRSLRTGSWKAIDAPRAELYDLRSDPAERQNVYATRRSIADRMIAEASRQAADLEGPAFGVSNQPDSETLQRLRSLGYVGGTVSPSATGRGLDPKEGIALFREYRRLTSEAIADLRAGRATAAAGKLKRLIAVNERAYDLHLFLGHAFVQQRKLEEALGEYTTAAARNPESVLPLLASADVELQRGRAAAARQLVESAARLEPASFEVQKMLGRVLEQEGRLPEALSAYERAVDLNPANPRSRALLASMALRLQRLDLAETNLRALIEMNYQPARTWYGLGRVAELRGLPDEAARHYRQALRADPGLAVARDALERLGRL
jgi:tetratricopeptide (TPR) repeat protein